MAHAWCRSHDKGTIDEFVTQPVVWQRVKNLAGE